MPPYATKRWARSPRPALHLFRTLSLLTAFFLGGEPFLGPLLYNTCYTSSAGVLPSIRMWGKVYLSPSGDKGRHGDLLPLQLDRETVIYLQVDDFRTSSKTRGALSLLEELQNRKPHVRVINGEVLAKLLTEETLRGKRVVINAFLYQSSRLLWIAETHVEE